jgi:hypothetical protein
MFLISNVKVKLYIYGQLQAPCLRKRRKCPMLNFKICSSYMHIYDWLRARNRKNEGWGCLQKSGPLGVDELCAHVAKLTQLDLYVVTFDKCKNNMLETTSAKKHVLSVVSTI